MIIFIFMVAFGMLLFAISCIIVASPSYTTVPICFALALWINYISTTFTNFIQSILWKKDGKRKTQPQEDKTIELDARIIRESYDLKTMGEPIRKESKV